MAGGLGVGRTVGLGVGVADGPGAGVAAGQAQPATNSSNNINKPKLFLMSHIIPPFYLDYKGAALPSDSRV